VEFQKPWFADNSPSLSEELRREVRPGHVLFGIEADPIARRHDRDDVLFVLRDGTNRLAVVHLTYTKETEPNFPDVNLFASVEEWEEAK
jgi:hypothetical protein